MMAPPNPMSSSNKAPKPIMNHAMNNSRNPISNSLQMRTIARIYDNTAATKVRNPFWATNTPMKKDSKAIIPKMIERTIT